MTAPLTHIGEQLEALIRIDEECWQLMTLESVLEIRLGQVYRALKKGCNELGFSSFGTYVRDRMGVCPRTARRAIELADGMERFPLVQAAFVARKLEATKALELFRYLEKHPEQEEVQVELATRLTVRGLREALGQEAEPDTRLTRTYRLKPHQYRALMQAIDLCRSVAGSHLSYSEAFELIVADLLAGVEAPELDIQVLGKRQRSRSVEEALERTWRQWDFLGARTQPLELLERPMPRGVLNLQREALELMETSRCWQMMLAQHLRELACMGMPCFANVGHYAVECLGMSASQARAMVQRDRCLEARPELREAVCEGRITPCQVDILWPAFERGLHTEPWVAFAERATCKDLELWVEYLLGLPLEQFEGWADCTPSHANPSAAPPPCQTLSTPLPDPDVDALCVMSLVPMAGLTLLLETLQTLSMPTEREERIPFRIQVEPEVLLNILTLEAALSLRAGEDLSRSLCAEATALAYVLCNEGNHQLRGQQKRLLFRDRFTCCAPGCTRRSKLHAHHIVLRSQRGPNGDENLIMLCSACHLRLVHLGFLKVTGTASEIRFERVGETFVNGLRVLA